MRIEVHEAFLPNDTSNKAAVIFELDIPGYLAAYRNATWKIFVLGHPSKPRTSSQPAMLLENYPQLKRHMKSVPNGISLASLKKSFLQTHFKTLKMKVNLSDVQLPLGLDFSYYDTRSGFWLKDLVKPLTFHHLCGIYVPRSLQVSVIPVCEHPHPNPEGPSSYETIASQTKCPSDMSVHEFMAYQRLLSGKTRRWLTILVELGASNLNSSAEDTMYVFTQLAVQAGPTEAGSSILRDAHEVFRDDLFCVRLNEQIENRLRDIKSNWRETNCMEILITLSLRLFSLTSGPARQSAERLLEIARKTTLNCISRLRAEVRGAVAAGTAERAAKYGFRAALLCRKTFAIFVEASAEMNASDLCSFVQASVALQENLTVDLSKINQNLKNMLVRDMKMAFQLQSLIRQSILSNHQSVGAAIDQTWFDSGESTWRSYSPWQLLADENQGWIVSNITSTINESSISQTVNYHFIEGYLLVDGKPLGRLPVNFSEAEDVKELFANQHLLTFPSSLGGMSHVLASHIHGQEIHFGLRSQNMIIRALTRDGLLEYVPQRVFRGNSSFDLPSSLIDNCVNWFTLHSKRLEIRRKPYVWKTRQSDWILDVSKRQAQRKGVLLVDPQSELFCRVEAIFRYFKDPQQLTVFQPINTKGRLSVELKRLELAFFVNMNRLLQCRELRADIDPNQDAGTLYGFESKIVLRDMVDNERRSVITAQGELSFERSGIHVAVRANSTDKYGRFGIDEVLGRLSCPPEPLLLYSKALFHSVTSFISPDPLTGRTGTEEALHILSSGYCQPWTPIADGPASVLRILGGLSPDREYYPKDKRRLQTVSWNEHLTTTIQHDSYRDIVREILAKSGRLLAFAPYENQVTSTDNDISSHLHRRGKIRRLLYERSFDPGTQEAGQDMVYKPRDRQASSHQAVNVYQIVRLTRQQEFTIHPGLYGCSDKNIFSLRPEPL